MKTCLGNARVILTDNIIEGYVVVEDGVILEVCAGRVPRLKDYSIVDMGGLFLSPGFIELHTHGAGGCDFMDGAAEAFITASKVHMEHGATTLYPTTLAASREEIISCIDAFREARKTMRDGPNMPGLHLEGPYLNINQKGAIDENYIRNPDPTEYKDILEYGNGVIARWTTAVELPGAIQFGRYLRELRILPSIGHSDAEYSEVVTGFNCGYTHITHLYSAMSGMVRRGGFRYPGVIESAFCLPEMTVEIIADGCHLPGEILEMVSRVKGVDKVCLISDSMRCAGQDVKKSVLGSLKNGRPVIIEDDVAKLPDRSAFAGSIATDDSLVRVMIQKAGVSVQNSVRMMTLTPAEIIGISNRKGSIEKGKDADLICFDDNITIKGVMINGKPISGIMRG